MSVVEALREFAASWDLFGDSYLVGWLVLVILSMTGVIVVARDQIFIGAAVSQASALGIAFALWLASLPSLAGAEWLAAASEDPHGSPFVAACAVLFSVGAAVLTSRAGAAGGTTHESLTGWVFLACASVSVLLVAHTPHGMEEVQRLLAPELIGATREEVWLFAALAAAVGAALLVVRRRALLVLTDEEMAAALGIRTAAWNVGLSVLLGVVVGLSLRCVGAFYTFAGLVLPCLAARNLCRRLLPMLVVGPAIGLGSGVAAFVVAHRLDLPLVQAAVAVLSAVVAGTAVFRLLRPKN